MFFTIGNKLVKVVRIPNNMSILWLFTILVSRGVVTIGNKVRRSGKDS